MESQTQDTQIGIFEEEKYSVKLDNFEGPLDLLLHLIKDAKMDITTVKLSAITEQYLEYMNQIPELDMDKASDFIEVAATLIEIKSKKLLPRPEELLPDEEDPEAKLLRQLQEYKIFKEASESLQTFENVDRFYKVPDKSAGNCKIILKDMSLDGLLDAFSNILAKASIKKEELVEKKITKDRFTVAEKIAAIKDAILFRESVRFSELLEHDNTKSEIINVFLALLELLKMQIVKAKQIENFTEIEIIRVNSEEQNND
ncbi:MAG: segregation/condensation protein A [Clostridia bacterium]